MNKLQLKPIKNKKTHEEALDLLEDIFLKYDMSDENNADISEYAKKLAALIKAFENKQLQYENLFRRKVNKFISSKKAFQKEKK